jgi:hypothetical protein
VLAIIRAAVAKAILIFFIWVGFLLTFARQDAIGAPHRAALRRKELVLCGDEGRAGLASWRLSSAQRQRGSSIRESAEDKLRQSGEG